MDSSFPSGHTAAAAAYGAIVVVVFWRFPQRSVRAVAVGLVAAVVLIVGFSRTYRGMHHIIDVLAGGLLGIAAVVAVWLLFRGRAAAAVPVASSSAP